MHKQLLIGACSVMCVAVGCGSSDDSKGGAAGATAQAGATAAQAGASAGAGAISAACQTYCECHEKNCAATAIPGGQTCAAFCAGMTADQLACRQNMCGLVPAQPDNDHCTHSVGINQCM